jgi:hypothetical protein
MMTTSRQTRVEAAAQRDAFLELVCSDEELVKAEFDAIVAAGRTSPPAGADVLGDQDRPLGQVASSPGTTLLRSGRRVSDLCWRRQRSPPAVEQGS